MKHQLCARPRVLERMETASSSLATAFRITSAAARNLVRGSGEVGLRNACAATFANRGDDDTPAVVALCDGALDRLSLRCPPNNGSHCSLET